VLVLRSSEITTYSGHGNGVGIHDYVDHRLGYRGRTMANIVDDVVAQGGMFIVNHAATDLGTACIGCGWKHLDDVPWDEVSALEVLTAGYLLGEGAYTPKVIAMWDALEDQGHRLSAVGGSDDHSAGMGAGSIGSPIGSPAALVLANELSETAIIDAVRHQHTMVQLRGPDDPFVDVKLQKRDGSLADVGDDVDGIADVAIPVRVKGASGMFIEVWRNGTKLVELPVTSDDFNGLAHDVPGKGDYRYRIELTDAGRRRVVVTSHFYVHAIDGAGGGCTAAGEGSPLALAMAGVGLLLRRRRQR
jgi:MYXO-CTERM domain-containing protein